MKRFGCIVVLFFSCCFLSLQAQESKNLTYSLFSGYGYVARTNDFMLGENVDNANINSILNFAFEITKDVDGSKAWHHLYNNIHFGAGLFYGRFNYSKNLGNPFGLYGLMGFTPVNTHRWQFKTDIALGISGIWDGYSQENYYNIAVSTAIECLIHARLQLQYNISGNWHAGLSGAFVHFSNGCIRRPNKGINIITPSVSVSYNPQKIVKQPYDNYVKHIPNVQRLVGMYSAVKGTWVDYTKDVSLTTGDTVRDTIRGTYAVFGLQYRQMYNLAAKHNLGVGGDISYNNVIGRTKGAYYKWKTKDKTFDAQRLTISAFVSYEYNINRFSLLAEPIVYLYKPENTYFTRLAQRIGMRYQFYKGWYYQLTLRAYQFTKADYIEGGIGYRFKYRM
ncbi:MAG: acyloxyacyl hydrolase [Bacteroidales bacterium]|nr:acyloxyacyl hydrolase [Bacteroidales bacterium]